MFSLLPFAAFVKRFSAKNETDARKRGFHPPARRVFPQKNSDNALPTFPGSFSGVRYGQIRFISFFRKKTKIENVRREYLSMRPPPPRLFRREAPTPAKPFPFSAKARRGTGTRARRAPPLPCARSAAAKSPRSSPDSISPDAPFPNSPRIYRISSFLFFLPGFSLRVRSRFSFRIPVRFIL